MKFTTLLCLVASASAIQMGEPHEPKCVKKGNDDKCVVPGSNVECPCPVKPPVVVKLVQVSECRKLVGGFGSTACLMKGTTNVYCECPEEPTMKKGNASENGLGQEDEKKCPKVPDGEGCVVEGTNAKCACPEAPKAPKLVQGDKKCVKGKDGKGCVKEGTTEKCDCPKK